ncbi:MAG: hypothetical protein JNJ73_03000 [Hyphomonadaceae bacterium]|nr:hypothetical protein [Hyphomonadaceae bacterium]
MRAFVAALVCAGLTGAAWAQSSPPPPPRPSGLVFHVAVTGAQPVVSLGMAQPAAAGALIRQRREMQADCTWALATDMTAPADSIVPLRDPAGLGGAEQFGDYYAQLFNALVTAKGATTTASQYMCVRRTMTTMAASLLQRRAEAGAGRQPAQGGAGTPVSRAPQTLPQGTPLAPPSSGPVSLNPDR